MSRHAFTMVELIFVIIVISILAAIALGKLSGSRDDAIDSTDCKNIAVCVTDMLAEYTAKQTATKENSPACVRAEASKRNHISITIMQDAISVSGAPKICSHLNTTSQFGGTHVSI
jgi:general secretion pathway protein G